MAKRIVVKVYLEDNTALPSKTFSNVPDAVTLDYAKGLAKSVVLLANGSRADVSLTNVEVGAVTSDG